jgi:hypothetical protein
MNEGFSPCDHHHAETCNDCLREAQRAGALITDARDLAIARAVHDYLLDALTSNLRCPPGSFYWKDEHLRWIITKVDNVLGGEAASVAKEAQMPAVSAQAAEPPSDLQPGEKIACTKCGSFEFTVTDGMERGAKMERQRAAGLLRAVLAQVPEERTGKEVWQQYNAAFIAAKQYVAEIDASLGGRDRASDGEQDAEAGNLAPASPAAHPLPPSEPPYERTRIVVPFDAIEEYCRGHRNGLQEAAALIDLEADCCSPGMAESLRKLSAFIRERANAVP